jgi:hypothetical protein
MNLNRAACGQGEITMSKNSAALLAAIEKEMERPIWRWNEDGIKILVGEQPNFRRGSSFDTVPNVSLVAARLDGVEVTVKAEPATDRHLRCVGWSFAGKTFGQTSPNWDKWIYDNCPALFTFGPFEGRGWVQSLAFRALVVLEQLLYGDGTKIKNRLADKALKANNSLEIVRASWESIALGYGVVVSEGSQNAVVIGKTAESFGKPLARALSVGGKLYVTYSLKTSRGKVSPLRLRLVADLAEAIDHLNAEVSVRL